MRAAPTVAIGAHGLAPHGNPANGYRLNMLTQRWRQRHQERASELKLARSVYADQDWQWAAQFDWDGDWTTPSGTDEPVRPQ
jgi:hypothetical protein